MGTHIIPFLNIKKKIILNYHKSAAMGFVPRDNKNGFETGVVKEPSVFVLLKFYCISELLLVNNLNDLKTSLLTDIPTLLLFFFFSSMLNFIFSLHKVA